MAAFSGQVGDLRWGYRVAARLQGWTLVPVAGSAVSRLRARVADVDSFAMARADRVRLEVGGKSWSWPIQGVQIAGGALVLELNGRPEVR